MRLATLGRTAAAAIFMLLVAGSAAGAQTVDLSTGALRIHAAVVSPSMFRISVNARGEATPLKSIFLDPNFTPATEGNVHENGTVRSISTSAGELQLDTKAGTLSLRDGQGKVLIPPAPIGEMMDSAKPAQLALQVGWPQDRPFEVYGCGNGADALVQHEIHSSVGNGTAVEPFFWSPAGFAVFVVGSDDNAPAQCDGHVAHGAITWSVPGAAADLYLMIAPNLSDASRALLDLTGHPPVPPRWTFGYLQSRWGWADEKYIDDTLRQFETRKIPVDAFIFDFEWYTTSPDYSLPPDGIPNFSDFGWNLKLFPHPAEQIKALHDAGVRFVGIRKPRLGNSQTLEEIRAKGWGFKSQNDVDTRGLLFANPDVRHWYAEQIEPLLREGIDGWWDDEGEFTYTNYIYWNMAEREALDAVNPKARLWTLDRAFQPGLSRTGAAAWTGDIHATWKDLQNTPASLLNWSVAGMPYCTCDIGGHVGEVTPELLTRWMEAGTFFPIMRTHSQLTVTPHFPWLFGADAEAAIKKSIELRYRLIPMLYSLAHEEHDTGEPLMRPVMMDFPNDPKLANESSEWLVGHNLLAAPMLEAGGHRTVYLPEGTWYDFATGEKLSGPRELDLTVPLDATPVYVRAGAILPLGPIVQHTRDLPGGPLELRIYPGRDAQFTLVEDDGLTTDYLNGAIRRTTFKWDDKTRELSWTRAGSYDGKDCFQSLRVALVGQIAPATAEQALRATGHIVIPQ